MKKLMIASPCHHGKCDTIFTLSLIQSLFLLNEAQVKTLVLLPVTGSLLAKERNDIIEVFWKSDCTHLLCIDSDIGWQADAPLKFLRYEKDVIAGVYPARRNNDSLPKFMFTPKTNSDDSLITDGPLIKMVGVPAGFLMVSRQCIAKLRNTYPDKKYIGSNNFDSAYSFFNTEVREGMMWGEDYIFCKNVIEASMDIWCDPTIEFNHAGTIGRLTEILTDKKPINNGVFEYKTITGR